MAEVYLCIYDLSEGLVHDITSAISGIRTLRGIWHTSTEVYGQEIQFGPAGVTIRPFGNETFTLKDKIHMGRTSVPYDELVAYLQFLNSTIFQGSSYNVFSHNCNCFSNFLLQEITGHKIPSYLLSHPIEVLSTVLMLIKNLLCHKITFERSL